MMKHEFEELAGYEVSFNDYVNIIEPMYMAANLSKKDFVKTINKKAFALKPLDKVIKEMKAYAKSLEETCTHFHDFDTEEKLENLINEYVDRKGYTAFTSHMINYKTKQTCCYPVSVTIYGNKSYKTIETIEF